MFAQLSHIFCRFRFDCEQPNFFDAGTRIYIINFILERQHFIEGEETPDNLGIEKLLADGVYESAYTLHDVSIITPFDFKISPNKLISIQIIFQDTDRDLLLSEWANIRKWKQ